MVKEKGGNKAEKKTKPREVSEEMEKMNVA